MQNIKLDPIFEEGKYTNTNIPVLNLEPKTVLSEKQIMDDAFYTAGAYSTSPLHDYFKIQAELKENGESLQVENAKKQFADEQNNIIKDQVHQIIVSPDVDPELKKQYLRQYGEGDFYIEQDLKKAFGSKFSSSTEGNYTQSDDDDTIKDQENLIPNIQEQEHEYNESVIEEHINDAVEAMITSQPTKATKPEGEGARNQEEFNDNYNFLLKNVFPKIMKTKADEMEYMTKIGKNLNFYLYTILDFVNYGAEFVKATVVDTKNFKDWDDKKAFVNEEHRQSTLSAILGVFANMQKTINKSIGFTEEEMYDTEMARTFEDLGEWIRKKGEDTAEYYRSFGDPNANTMIARMSKPLEKGDWKLDGGAWGHVYEGLLFFLPLKGLKSKVKGDLNYKIQSDLQFEHLQNKTKYGGPDFVEGSANEGINIYKVNDIEVSASINNIKPKADTPLSISLISNPKQTVKMIETAFDDISGEAFKALRTTPEEVINWFYKPSFLTKKTYGNHIELQSTIQDLIGIQNRGRHTLFLNPNDSMYGARHKYLHNIGLMVDTPDVFYPSSSLSELRSFYDRIGAKVVYRRDPTHDFNSRAHVVEVFEQLNQYLDSLKLPKDHRGTLVIEDVLNPNAKPFRSAKELYNDAKYSQDNLSAKDKQFRINWYTESRVDPLAATLDGLDTVQFGKFGKLMLPLVDNIMQGLPNSWQLFLYTGRFPKAFDKGLVTSSLRGTGLGVNQLEFLANKIKTTNYKFKSDLMQILHANDHVGRSVTKLDDITDLFPNKTLAERKSLHETVAVLERINDFNYFISNQLKKQQLVQDGFNRSIVVTKGADGFPNKRVPVKEVFVYDRLQHPVVFDTVTQKPIAFKPKDPRQQSIDARDRRNTNNAKDGVFDADGRQLVLLSEPLTLEHGVIFPYALLGTKEIAKSLPNNVIPRKHGYMSRHMEATLFVRRYPRQVSISGRDYTAANMAEAQAKFGDKGTVGNFKETVGVSDNAKTAQRYVEDFERQDSKYFYEVEKAAEDVFSEYQTAERMITNIRNSSRQRSTNEIRGAQFEDIGATFHREAVALPERFSMDSIVNQYKDIWVQTFEGKINPNIFVKDAENNAARFPIERPKVSDIALSSSKENIRMAQQAIAVWDRINLSMMGVPDNILVRGARHLFDFIADNTPTKTFETRFTKGLEKTFRKVSRDASFYEGAPQRVTSTLLITLNLPMKHWVLQPQAVLDTMFVNGPSVGIANMYNMTGLIHAYMKDSVYLGKYREGFTYMIDELYSKGYIAKTNNLDKKLILNRKDLELIATEIKESGHGLVDQHVMNQGIFSSDPIKFEPTKTFFGKAKDLTQLPFEKLTTFTRNVGFNFGEQLNRFGMWLSAKSIWEANNPGKNWRTRKALDQINYDAWELAGSMTKEGTYLYQRIPILKWFTQFMSYPQKASEMLLNPKAGPLSRNQRIGLAAWRAYFYGIRSGTAYGIGNMLYNAFNDVNKEFAQKLADLLDTDAGMNMILNAMINQAQDGTDADLDFAKTLSPLGGTGDTPYTQMMQIMQRLVGKDISPYEAGNAPVLEQFERLQSWWNTVHRFNVYHGGALKPENMLELFKRSARLTTGTNALSRAYKRKMLQEKLNRYGQEVGLEDEGSIEGFIGGLLGVQDKAEAKIYESFNNGGYKKPSDLERIAKSLYEDYVKMTPEANQNFATYYKYKQDIHHTNESYYTEDESLQMLEYMDDAFNRSQGKSMKDSRIDSLKQLQELDPKSKRAIENLVDDKETQELFETLYKDADFNFKKDKRGDNK